MSTFDEVLRVIREEAAAQERGREPAAIGTAFERLMLKTLCLLPDYSIKRAWRWENWPDRPVDSLRKDTGVDLVAETHDGEIWAVQCKCYREETRITKKHLDNFLAHGGAAWSDRMLWIDTSGQRMHRDLEALTQSYGDKWMRLGIDDLRTLPLAWDIHRPERSRIERRPHEPREDQARAIDAIAAELAAPGSRTSALMACGSGKTLVSIRASERVTPAAGCTVVVAPSIALVHQTLRAWWEHSRRELHTIAVCSDGDSAAFSRRGDRDRSRAGDLGIRARTAPENIAGELCAAEAMGKHALIAATYHSYHRIKPAMALAGRGPVDLLILDEAHRTTGMSESDAELRVFQQVHNDAHGAAARRLYMTATAKIYAAGVKKQMARSKAVLYSMDNPDVYGADPAYELPYDEAVRLGIVCEFKVVVLLCTAASIAADPELHKHLGTDPELKADDYAKLAGVVKALAQRQDHEGTVDQRPIRRAVLFTNRVKTAYAVANAMPKVADDLGLSSAAGELACEARAIAGKDGSARREQELRWLRKGGGGATAHVLCNAQCLAEGVDVPALDAIVVWGKKRSIIEITQAVGRAVRKDPSNPDKVGYVIVPVVVAEGADPESALTKSPDWGTLANVLAALRSHHPGWEARLQQLVLGETRALDGGLMVVLADVARARPAPLADGAGKEDEAATPEQMPLSLRVVAEQLRPLVVKRFGRARYWRDWAQSVGHSYEALQEVIGGLIKSNAGVRSCVAAFEAVLRDSVHQGIDRAQTVSMLAQHQITRPIFRALFGREGARGGKPPMSTALETAMNELEARGTALETNDLKGFYTEVGKTVEGMQEPRSRQQLLRELYDGFFKQAFGAATKSMGIAYTPEELIDWVLYMADDGVRQLSHGQRGLGCADVHVMDPFAGTGQVLVRAISDARLVSRRQCLGKWERREWHFNEIELLAYCIANANIEQAQEARVGESVEFVDGALTDTFEALEVPGGGQQEMDFAGARENQATRRRQRRKRIEVIVGNPPWSAFKGDGARPSGAREGIQGRVKTTIVERSSSSNRNSLYDDYVLAIRWALDKIGDEGVVSFVLPNGWLTGNAGQGVRRMLHAECARVDVVNLLGEARGSGEVRRRQGANPFGDKSKSGVCLTRFIKRAAHAGPGGDSVRRGGAVRQARHQAAMGLRPWPVAPNMRNGKRWSRMPRDLGSTRSTPRGAALTPLCEKGSVEAVFEMRSSGLKTAGNAVLLHGSRKGIEAATRKAVAHFNDCLRAQRGARWRIGRCAVASRDAEETPTTSTRGAA